jgi:hypothetical protein
MTPSFYDVVFTAFALVFAVAAFGFSVVFVEYLVRKPLKPIPLREMTSEERNYFA